MTTFEVSAVEPSLTRQAVGAPARGWPSVELEDLSPTLAQRSWRNTLRAWRGPLLRVTVPALLLLVWQISSALHLFSEQLLPAPTAVLAAYAELWRTGDLQLALVASLQRAFAGLAIGASLGLVLGIWAGLWKLGEEIFDAPLQMLRTIPFIAIVPLLVMWFGIEEKPKIILIAAATVFPMYLNTYHGVRGVDAKLIEAAQVFGLGGWRLSLRVILPTALPQILTGLRYALGVSLLALVLAEQINALEGMGHILLVANLNQRTDIIIAGVLVYALFGIFVDLFMRLVEKYTLPWRVRVSL